MQNHPIKRSGLPGGGTEIGAGAAVALARSGAEVFVSGRRREPLDTVFRVIVEIGGADHAIHLGVGDANEAAAAGIGRLICWWSMPG